MRYVTLIAPAVLLASTVIAADEPDRTFKFTKESLAKVPPGWKADKTGTGEGSIWKIVEDKTAPGKTGYALAQTAESPNAMFNLCIAEDTNFKDVEVKIAFKANKGANDQGGGIVWRYQDANNYYVARMNPLEDNYRLYHVVAGKRTQFGGVEGVKVPTGEWHTLMIKQVGDSIECYLDGKKQIEANDSTITKAGKIGLWSKADAQSSFDAVQVKNLGK
jgi:hypothetical protein